ncbi:MAG: aminotransferase class V-fold PLP-dependent enzyme [Campylobacteraceae bacterium]
MQDFKKNIILDKDILYFDFTASGLGYKPIERKLQKILKTYANTHSEVSSSAKITSEYYSNGRKSLHKTLEISDDFYILPTGTGATGAIKRFQEILGLYIPPKTKKRLKNLDIDLPLVLVGPYEHHSNEVSFREALCELIRIPLDCNEKIDLNVLKKTLEQNKHREIIASFSVASNVTGVLSDYKEIYKLVKSYGGIVALDSATASAHMNVDCNFYDALFLSPHKLIGGVGSSGILVIKKDLCKDYDTPTFAGGGTVGYVSRVSQRYLDDFELREDAGTPGILQFIKASLAYELRNKIGLEFIKKQESELRYYFGKSVKKIKNINLYCNHEQDKLPIFSLNIKGVNPYIVAAILSDKYGIQTRPGCNCAGPYGHDLLGYKDDENFSEKPGWLRVSLHFSHTKEDVDRLINALKDIAKSHE